MNKKALHLSAISLVLAGTVAFGVFSGATNNKVIASNITRIESISTQRDPKPYKSNGTITASTVQQAFDEERYVNIALIGNNINSYNPGWYSIEGYGVDISLAIIISAKNVVSVTFAGNVMTYTGMGSDFEWSINCCTSDVHLSDSFVELDSIYTQNVSTYKTGYLSNDSGGATEGVGNGDFSQIFTTTKTSNSVILYLYMTNPIPVDFLSIITIEQLSISYRC